MTADSNSTPQQSDTPAITEGATQRVMIDLTPKATERLDLLKEEAGAASKGKLVLNALRLYEFFLNRREEGFRIMIVKDGEAKEVELLF